MSLFSNILGELSWIAGRRSKEIALASVVGVGLYFFNSYLKKLSDETILQLKKKRGLDILKINRMLTFGPGYKSCYGHNLREFDCGNLNCNFGKFRYLLNFFEESKVSLDVCIYIITIREVAERIIAAAERGVRVRVISDFNDSFHSGAQIKRLIDVNIPVRMKKSNFIMHHKFIIVDDELLITGSMNFTMSGVFRNWENVIVTSLPLLVSSFKKGFEDIWLEFDPKKLHAELRSKES